MRKSEARYRFLANRKFSTIFASSVRKVSKRYLTCGWHVGRRYFSRSAVVIDAHSQWNKLHGHYAPAPCDDALSRSCRAKRRGGLRSTYTPTYSSQPSTFLARRVLAFIKEGSALSLSLSHTPSVASSALHRHRREEGSIERFRIRFRAIARLDFRTARKHSRTSSRLRLPSF